MLPIGESQSNKWVSLFFWSPAVLGNRTRVGAIWRSLVTDVRLMAPILAHALSARPRSGRAESPAGCLRMYSAAFLLITFWSAETGRGPTVVKPTLLNGPRLPEWASFWGRGGWCLLAALQSWPTEKRESSSLGLFVPRVLSLRELLRGTLVLSRTIKLIQRNNSPN